MTVSFQNIYITCVTKKVTQIYTIQKNPWQIDIKLKVPHTNIHVKQI